MVIDAAVHREKAETEALGPSEDVTDGAQEAEHIATPPFIFKLPNETLAATFQLCVDADTRGHALSKDAVQWVLAHTCHRWRQVLLSTPSLWSMVRINGHRFPRDPVQMVRTWLDRSQSLPLSCSLLERWSETVNAKCPSNPLDQQDEIFDLILAQSRRWCHVNMVLNDCYRDPGRKLAAINGLTLPLLESFYMLAEPGSFLHRPIEGTAWVTFPLSPVLSSASIDISMPYMNHHVAPLPWFQLVELRVRLFTSEGFPDIVNSLKVLKYCSILIAKQAITFDVQLMVLPLSLRHLEVSGCLNDVVNLLNHLSAPHLSNLHIRLQDIYLLAGINIGPLSASVFAFLTRSHCQLRKLNVPSIFFDYVDLRTDDLSTLEELHIQFQTKVRIDRIMGNLVRFYSLPNVKEMHLIVSEIHYRGPAMRDFLIGMIDTRRWASQERSQSFVALDCVGLEILGVNGPIRRMLFTGEILGRLKKLQQDGSTVLGNIFNGRLRPLHSEALDHWNIETNECMKVRFGYGYNDGLKGGLLGILHTRR